MLEQRVTKWSSMIFRLYGDFNCENIELSPQITGLDASTYVTLFHQEDFSLMYFYCFNIFGIIPHLPVNKDLLFIVGYGCCDESFSTDGDVVFHVACFYEFTSKCKFKAKSISVSASEKGKILDGYFGGIYIYKGAEFVVINDDGLEKRITFEHDCTVTALEFDHKGFRLTYPRDGVGEIEVIGSCHDSAHTIVDDAILAGR